jgi:hypothetical protein
MRRKKLRAFILVVAIVVAALTLLMLIASASAQRGEPLVYVTFLGHTNGPDGVGLNTFSISNGSPFRVNRRAVLILFDSSDVPQDAVAGMYKVLNPHATEVFDVEDLHKVTGSWRLKVACVAVEGDAHCFLREVIDVAHDVGIPARRLQSQSPHEVYKAAGVSQT